MVTIEFFIYVILSFLLVLSLFNQFVAVSGLRRVYFSILSDLNLFLIVSFLSDKFGVLDALSEIIFLILLCVCIKNYLLIVIMNSSKS